MIRNFKSSDINNDYVSWLNDKNITKFSNQRFMKHQKTCKDFYNSIKKEMMFFFNFS